MSVILSAIAFLIFFIYNNKILADKYSVSRIVYDNAYGQIYYTLSPLMLYVIFIIVTGPIFLNSPFTQVKYIVYFGSLIYLLINKRLEVPRNYVITTYWLFYIWLLICTLHSPDYGEAIAFLLKYLIPVCSIYLGYTAFSNRYDLLLLLKITAIWCLGYTFIIGGLAETFYPWLYHSPFGDLFIKYAGLADYFTSLFIVPFILVWMTNNKTYYWIAAAMIFSTILETVRTGLGGMILVLSSYLFLRYKARSVPLIAAVAVALIAIVLFVPSVNSNFFGDKAGKVTVTDIINDDAMSMDNIQTSGRESMWDVVQRKCYVGHEIVGSGLGSASSYLKYLRSTGFNIPGLLHNDYVQIKCDTGLVGLVLFGLFYLSILQSILVNTWKTENELTKITGIMAVSSFFGIAFSMGFDNVVSHSMSSMIMPFIFFGMYFKSLNR